MPGKWEAFKNDITKVQRQYFPVRVKGKAEEEVLDGLKCMKVDKSLGPDQVYPRTLREAREVVGGPFADIFVSSIATGEVSEDWRLANVVPLFKNGGKEKSGNLRPVKLTSVV
eukprot:g24014.t1